MAAAPLRIAHVDAERGFSGGEVQVFLLMEGLRRRGHENLLVCPPGSLAAQEALRRGFLTRLTHLRHDLDLRSVGELTRWFRRDGLDLVHLHTGRAAWLGGLAAMRAHRLAIVTRRMDRRVRRGWRTRLIYRRFTRRAVAISPAVAECLRAGAVPAERIRVIPSAVDSDRVRPRRGRAETRAALGAAAGDCVLLALAALEPRKGLDVLLAAVAALPAGGPAVVVWLAGEGSRRDTLEAQAQALGLGETVRFLGRRDHVGDLLAASDVCVLPSRREGLGIAALEAMAAGRAVVASAVGGLGEAVVHERSGLLVPPDDRRALTQALARLVGDPALRERLAAAGPARVAEGFLPEQMVDAYERLYREVLAETKDRGRTTGE